MARLHLPHLCDPRRGLRAGLGSLAILMIGLAAQAAEPQAPLAAQFAALARPELDQSTGIAHVTLSWQGMRFTLDQGRLALGTSSGRITAAVFAGSGTVAVALPTAPPWRRQVEAGQLVRYLDRNQLQGGITQAVFRFADAQLFRQALGSAVQFTAGDPGGDLRHILEDRSRQQERRGDDGLARLQRALDSPQPDSLLLAEVKRKDDGEWVEMRFDPATAEPQVVQAESKPGEPSAIWTQYAPPGWPPPAHAQVANQRLTVTVDHRQHLAVTATFTLNPSTGRGIVLRLDPRMRVSQASLPWYQPPAPADWLYLELPTTGPAQVSIEFGGDAVIAAPEDHDWVTAPAWYPAPGNARYRAPTQFSLEVSAEGRPEGRAVQPSATSAPAQAAGFAWGEDALDSRKLQLADGKTLALTVAVPDKEDPRALTALAGTRSVEILNFLAAENGPLSYADERVVVSGAVPAAPLPGLISLDPRSFVGLSPELTQFAPALSAAGQWWGTAVTAASPHEEWLMAGLRQLDALLFQESRYGDGAGQATVRAWRQYLSQPQDGRPPLAAGPLWLGEQRLSAPAGFHGGLDGNDLLEAKGGAELYMLRQLLWQPRSPTPDAAFRALLHDLTRHYAGHAITNAEFQAAAEAHMSPAMDLDHNHKLDWFFQPLLYGTTVPKLHFTATAQGNAVSMTVENPDHWRGLLPVYLFRNSSQWIRGLMPVTDDHNQMTITAPFSPQYIQANYLEDMLVDVIQ